MIPAWESAVVRAPFYLYLHAFPLWHLAIAVERTWATLRAYDYEKASATYGMLCTLLVVCIKYVCCHGTVHRLSGP